MPQVTSASATTALAPGTGNVAGDPLFAPSTGNEFYLEPTSPLVDAAPLGLVSDDIEGEARPKGALADIGSDEAG